MIAKVIAIATVLTIVNNRTHNITENFEQQQVHDRSNRALGFQDFLQSSSLNDLIRTSQGLASFESPVDWTPQTSNPVTSIMARINPVSENRRQPLQEPWQSIQIIKAP